MRPGTRHKDLPTNKRQRNDANVETKQCRGSYPQQLDAFPKAHPVKAENDPRAPEIDTG